MLSRLLEPHTSTEKAVLKVIGHENKAPSERELAHLVDVLMESERNFCEGWKLLFQKVQDLRNVSMMAHTVAVFTYIVSMASSIELYGRPVAGDNDSLSTAALVDRVIVGLVEVTPFLRTFRTSHHNIPEYVRDAALNLLSLVEQHSRVLQQQREHSTVAYASTVEGSMPPPHTTPTSPPPLPRAPPPALRKHSTHTSAPAVSMASVAAAVSGAQCAGHGNAVLVQGSEYDVVVLDASHTHQNRRASAGEYVHLTDDV